MTVRLAAGSALAAGFALTFALSPWSGELVTDLPLYAWYAAAFADGTLPYRDVGFEYPPLAAPLIALPGAVSLDPEGYRLAFAGLALALAAALLAVTGRLARLTGGREAGAVLALALAPLATGAMIRTHFDLAPVLCLAIAVAAVAGGRTTTGFAVLGVGGALKAFPLAAAPIAAAWLAGRGQTAAAVRGLAAATAVTLAVIVGALALSPSGAWDAVSYHFERPVQVESLPATLLNAGDALGARAPTPVHSHRSDGLEHPAAGALAAVFMVLLAAALAALTFAAYRLGDRRSLALAALGSAAAFATLGKVLSPQFMLWLLPLAALAWAWGMRLLAAATTASIALTLSWFPSRYFDLVDREPVPLALAGVRNALLVAVLALVARELVRALRAPRAAARSTARSRPHRPRSARS